MRELYSSLGSLSVVHPGVTIRSAWESPAAIERAAARAEAYRQHEVAVADWRAYRIAHPEPSLGVLGFMRAYEVPISIGLGVTWTLATTGTLAGGWVVISIAATFVLFDRARRASHEEDPADYLKDLR